MYCREFLDSVTLRWALGALIFSYFIVFDGWVRDSSVTLHAIDTFQYVCPRYFQSCDNLYFLNALPHGYSQTIFYMGIFALLIGAVYAMSQQKWQLAQRLLFIPFVWHAINIFLLSDYRNGNYEYYLFIFGVTLLLLPHKEFFLKLFLVSFYTLSTVAKLHPAWIAGTYFSSLQLGLPLVPDTLIPIATNFVILMEMIGAWFLFSKNKIVQRGVFYFFVFFHLYSGVLVEYRYPATVLPMILILFGPWYKHSPVPLDRKSLIGWGILSVLICLQFIPTIIPGDEKLTLEGNKYGMYMFESNHQCISKATLYMSNGRQIDERWEAKNARNRCDPYRDWFKLNKRCETYPQIESIAWTFDHSINGDPFLRIVDTEDLCSLEYNAFSHNQWIQTHEDNPKRIGVPVKNQYY